MRKSGAVLSFEQFARVLRIKGFETGSEDLAQDKVLVQVLIDRPEYIGCLCWSERKREADVRIKEALLRFHDTKKALDNLRKFDEFKAVGHSDFARLVFGYAHFTAALRVKTDGGVTKVNFRQDGDRVTCTDGLCCNAKSPEGFAQIEDVIKELRPAAQTASDFVLAYFPGKGMRDSSLLEHNIIRWPCPALQTAIDYAPEKGLTMCSRCSIYDRARGFCREYPKKECLYKLFQNGEVKLAYLLRKTAVRKAKIVPEGEGQQTKTGIRLTDSSYDYLLEAKSHELRLPGERKDDSFLLLSPQTSLKTLIGSRINDSNIYYFRKRGSQDGGMREEIVTAVKEIGWGFFGPFMFNLALIVFSNYSNWKGIIVLVFFGLYGLALMYASLLVAKESGKSRFEETAGIIIGSIATLIVTVLIIIPSVTYDLAQASLFTQFILTIILLALSILSVEGPVIGLVSAKHIVRHKLDGGARSETVMERIDRDQAYFNGLRAKYKEAIGLVEAALGDRSEMSSGAWSAVKLKVLEGAAREYDPSSISGFITQRFIPALKEKEFAHFYSLGCEIEIPRIAELEKEYPVDAVHKTWVWLFNQRQDSDGLFEFVIPPSFSYLTQAAAIDSLIALGMIPDGDPAKKRWFSLHVNCSYPLKDVSGAPQKSIERLAHSLEFVQMCCFTSMERLSSLDDEVLDFLYYFKETSSRMTRRKPAYVHWKFSNNGLIEYRSGDVFLPSPRYREMFAFVQFSHYGLVRTCSAAAEPGRIKTRSEIELLYLFSEFMKRLDGWRAENGGICGLAEGSKRGLGMMSAQERAELVDFCARNPESREKLCLEASKAVRQGEKIISSPDLCAPSEEDLELVKAFYAVKKIRELPVRQKKPVEIPAPEEPAERTVAIRPAAVVAAVAALTLAVQLVVLHSIPVILLFGAAFLSLYLVARRLEPLRLRFGSKSTDKDGGIAYFRVGAAPVAIPGEVTPIPVKKVDGALFEQAMERLKKNSPRLHFALCGARIEGAYWCRYMPFAAALGCRDGQAGLLLDERLGGTVRGEAFDSFMDVAMAYFGALLTVQAEPWTADHDRMLAAELAAELSFGEVPEPAKEALAVIMAPLAASRDPHDTGDFSLFTRRIFGQTTRGDDIRRLRVFASIKVFEQGSAPYDFVWQKSVGASFSPEQIEKVWYAVNAQGIVPRYVEVTGSCFQGSQPGGYSWSHTGRVAIRLVAEDRELILNPGDDGIDESYPPMVLREENVYRITIAPDGGLYRKSDGGKKADLVVPEGVKADLENEIAAIREKIRQKESWTSETFIILVAGKSCSGKTSVVADVLAERFQAKMVNLDNYYRGLTFMREHGYDNFDIPQVFDFDLLRKHMVLFQRGQAVDMPKYSFKTGEREGYERFEPSKVLILEGIFALREEIACFGDHNIFVDVGRHGQMIRRFNRDVVSGRTGQGFRQVLAQMLTQVIPAEKEYLEPTMHNADTVIMSDYDPQEEARKLQNFECSAKACVEDLAPFEAALAVMGAKPRDTVIQKDIYYTPMGRDLASSGEILRIRDEHGRFSMTYKGPLMTSELSLRPVVKVPFEKEWLPFMEKDYVVLLPIVKKRSSFELGDLVIHLDDVEGLGKFVEAVGHSADCEVRVAKLLVSIGVPRGHIISESYFELMAAKDGGERDSKEKSPFHVNHQPARADGGEHRGIKVSLGNLFFRGDEKLSIFPSSSPYAGRILVDRQAYAEMTSRERHFRIFTDCETFIKETGRVKTYDVMVVFKKSRSTLCVSLTQLNWIESSRCPLEIHYDGERKSFYLAGGVSGCALQDGGNVLSEMKGLRDEEISRYSRYLARVRGDLARVRQEYPGAHKRAVALKTAWLGKLGKEAGDDRRIAFVKEHGTRRVAELIVELERVRGIGKSISGRGPPNTKPVPFELLSLSERRRLIDGLISCGGFAGKAVWFGDSIDPLEYIRSEVSSRLCSMSPVPPDELMVLRLAVMVVAEGRAGASADMRAFVKESVEAQARRSFAPLAKSAAAYLSIEQINELLAMDTPSLRLSTFLEFAPVFRTDVAYDIARALDAARAGRAARVLSLKRDSAGRLEFTGFQIRDMAVHPEADKVIELVTKTFAGIVDDEGKGPSARQRLDLAFCADPMKGMHTALQLRSLVRMGKKIFSWRQSVDLALCAYRPLKETLSMVRRRMENGYSPAVAVFICVKEHPGQAEEQLLKICAIREAGQPVFTPSMAAEVLDTRDAPFVTELTLSYVRDGFPPRQAL
ncbi:MAG: class IV adenylate cyclase, partial [Deltaproteobacteria bacterium]